MNHKMMPWLALVILLLLAGSALAQSSPHYRLEWSTMSGMGQPAISAHYAVRGALGAVTGDEPPASSRFRVQGSFWAPFLYEYSIYLPIVIRGAH